MPSKQEDGSKSRKISPVLFMTVDGEPMRFFLRPGPAKVHLQPCITGGGGVVCKAQEPGAILLAEPEEMGSFPESAAHWYVSTQYIRDCIDKNLQLDVEDYRLNTEQVQRRSTRQTANTEVFAGLSGGRLAYTSEEDAAILKYVSKRKTETGGNTLWQEMGKKHVTNHSWQSMKHRYKARLAHRQSEVEEEERTEGETKVGEDQKTDIQNLSCDKDDPPPPQTHSADTAATDLTQTDAQPKPAESMQPETVEAQTPSSPEQEVLCVDPQTNGQPIPVESTQPENVEPQTTSSPEPEVVPEDSPPAQAETLPDTPPKKQKKKQAASPKPVRPQRRSTRRHPEEPPSPQPYGKKLRLSSPCTPQKATPSPQPSRKTKSAEENGQVTPSKKTKTDEGANTVAQKEPEKGGKRKEKRKLGVLELATKEFEDESESEQDETTDLQNPTETVATQPRSTEPPLPTAATAAIAAAPQSAPGHAPSLQESRQEVQASSKDPQPETGCPVPAPSEPVPSTSKAHLFIFESESQEEESDVGDNTAAPSVPQPLMNKDAAISLTQMQLEEDKQRIRGLMKQTNQDLVSVTKALLKTSGDFSAALSLLLTPSSFTGPIWNRHDDSLLLSADPAVRQELQEKYGEEDVAKRLVFLEV
ncbi:telomeric repeat-binding factor 2-interacting protein 1 [Centroberyx gerrardi]